MISFPRYATFFFFLALHIACQSKDTSPVLPSEVLPSSAAKPLEVDAAAPLAIEEGDERRFCNDDIFSVYLQKSYVDRSAPKVQDKKNMRRIRQEAELEAYTKLNADLPVAFGGLPVQATQRVYAWIDYFTGRGRGEFLLWLVRSESFRRVVIPLLEQEGLPPEFFFLAMIESGFSNTAFSRASATGTWQFMKPTAKYYGLAIDYWVDERRDPIKSTLAAARYLKDLHRQFKDWYLAIAAYNAGPNKVTRAIRGTQSRDYWTLSRSPYLLPETKNYVPKMLAALIIASHPTHYGFSVAPDIRHTTPLTTIKLLHPHRLSDIADRLAIPVRELQRWNPEIIRGITPPLSTRRRSDAYNLRLPAPLVQRFQSVAEDLVRLSIDDVQMHRIQKGETLAAIARRYKVSLQQLYQFNPNLKPLQLKPGQNIAVPIPAIMGEGRRPEAG